MERIQKIIARCTRYSRRAAEDLIREGRVSVNGETAGIGDQADLETDRITLDGKPLVAAPSPEYILLNKPRGYLCTVSDPQGRHTVLELIQPRGKVYPVGRLDMYSMGLVLLTNDGDLTVHMTRAGRHCPKVYLVKAAGTPGEHLLDQLRKGIQAEGVRYAPCEVEARRSKPGSYSWFKVTLFQGKNRQIRKMFEAIHHPVFQIKRIAIGPLTDSGLEVGQWRRLTEEEIRQLKRMPVKLEKVTPTARAPRGTAVPATDDGEERRVRPSGRPSLPGGKNREGGRRPERPPRRKDREGGDRPERPPRRESRAEGGPPERTPRREGREGRSPGRSRPPRQDERRRVELRRPDRSAPPRDESPGDARSRSPRQGSGRPERGNRPDRPRRGPKDRTVDTGSSRPPAEARETRGPGRRPGRPNRADHDRAADSRETPERSVRPRRPAGKPPKARRPGRPPKR